MIFYQILNVFCFVMFIVNLFFLLHLYKHYAIPEQLYGYIFFSIVKNAAGAITQLYSFPFGCIADWWIKSFAITVCVSSFYWCISTRKITDKKPKFKTK